ncbi:hypothetical protein, partial [Gluconobacter albidus]|uniref:hypothetical protein n=1 Tax=Gluconobacter albidus TaxID=318683 RepID=UPI001E417EF0
EITQLIFGQTLTEILETGPAHLSPVQTQIFIIQFQPFSSGDGIEALSCCSSRVLYSSDYCG